jgi:hypothetical protein
MPRSLDEIAVDVADLLKLDSDDEALAQIVQQLIAVRGLYRFSDNDVVKAGQLSADIAVERARLAQLKDKWPRIAAVAIVCDRADYELATLAEVSGPDPRYRWFDDVCAIMARSMILQSPNKRLGKRHRKLAGYLYEAATGEPNRSFDMACRRISRHRSL